MSKYNYRNSICHRIVLSLKECCWHFLKEPEPSTSTGITRTVRAEKLRRLVEPIFSLSRGNRLDNCIDILARGMKYPGRWIIQPPAASARKGMYYFNVYRATGLTMSMPPYRHYKACPSIHIINSCFFIQSFRFFLLVLLTRKDLLLSSLINGALLWLGCFLGSISSRLQG